MNKNEFGVNILETSYKIQKLSKKKNGERKRQTILVLFQIEHSFLSII